MISIKNCFCDNELLRWRRDTVSETSGHQFGDWSSGTASGEEELETGESADEPDGTCFSEKKTKTKK